MVKKKKEEESIDELRYERNNFRVMTVIYAVGLIVALGFLLFGNAPREVTCAGQGFESVLDSDCLIGCVMGANLNLTEDSINYITGNDDEQLAEIELCERACIAYYNIGDDDV